MEAPVGTQLAVGAAAFKWLGALFMALGFGSASHSNELLEKYDGDLRQMGAVMRNFTHRDCVPLIQDRFVTMDGANGWFVMDGFCDSIASLLALCALMCLKTQMNWNTSSPNEQELIMFAAFFLGLFIPMLEFCLRTGPITAAAMAGSAAALDEDASYSWSSTHFQFLFLAIQVVESLFTWLNVLAFFSLAVGFLILSWISAERASLVIYSYHRNLGYVIGAFFLLCFLCGLAREVFWWFDAIVFAFESLLGFILLPTWFVMLGIGLANCSSIEDLNAEFGDAVALAAANIRDAKRDASEQAMATQATEKAGRPGMVERANQKASPGGAKADATEKKRWANPMISMDSFDDDAANGDGGGSENK